MNDTKKPLESTTIKAALTNIIAVIALMVSLWGYDVGATLQQDLVQWCLSVWLLVGSGVTIYGRVKASKQIRSK